MVRAGALTRSGASGFRFYLYPAEDLAADRRAREVEGDHPEIGRGETRPGRQSVRDDE
jgi:hypothetical protein